MPCPPLVLIALVLAVLFGFAHGPPAAMAQPAKPNLNWSPCAEVPDTECTGLEVPVDPARPDSAKFKLRLGRVRASDPADRKGVLMFIPGGPGAGIRGTFGGETRALQHVADFQRHYDVVTFDPRGIGESSPIRCAPDAVPSTLMPVDRPPSAAEFEAVARANATFFKSCFEATGELMAHLSAMDTAADIERIRQALSPADGLVAYAASYGTVYGAAYLEQYGEHVKALVLDAVVDHSVDMPTFIARNVLSAKDAFDRFAQWCDKDRACALHGKDLGAVFDAVVTTAPATRSLVPQLLATGPDPELGWPALARMLAQVSGGDTTALKAMTGAAALAGTADDPWNRVGKDGLFAGVLCADFGPQRDYAALTIAGAAVARATPRFAWKFWDASPLAHGTAGIGDCAGWPREASNPPHRLQAGSHPNVMVATPTHNSATPLVNALSVWLQNLGGAPADRRCRRPSKLDAVTLRIRGSGPFPG